MSTHEHTTHVCKDCGETKPISGFYLYKSGKPYTNCKVCRGKRGNEWRKQNPEKSLAYTKAWIEKNRESHDAKKREYMARYRKEKPEVYKAWREARKEYFSEYMRKWMHSNRAHLRVYEKKYRAENLDLERARDRAMYAKRREHYAKYAREWRKANKERHAINQRVNGQKRRARLRGVGGIITATEIKSLLKKQRGMCPACKKKLGKGFHLDHIVPIVKGGANVVTNAQLLHPRCNSSKQARDPIEFMRSLGFLL